MPSDTLAGKTVCFTGCLVGSIEGSAITRSIAQELATAAGLVVSDGVTKSLDILVVADPNTQSGKARQARRLGTRLMAEAAFWHSIGIQVERHRRRGGGGPGSRSTEAATTRSHSRPDMVGCSPARFPSRCRRGSVSSSPSGSVAPTDGWRLRRTVTAYTQPRAAPFDLHFRRVPKESPLLADKVPVLRCLCVDEMAVSRSWLACPTATAAEAESPPSAGRWERRDPRRSPGRLKGHEAESNGSAGSPIPSTSWEARSEATEVTRLRMSRSQRRPNAWGMRIASGRRRDRRRLVGAAPTRRLPWQAVATSEGDERGHEHMILRRGRSRLSAAVRRGKGAGHALLDAYGEAPWDSPPTPRPRLGRQAESWRAVQERMGSPGHLAPRSLPLKSTRVRTQSPAQDPWRGIRESLPREADRDCLEDRTDA